MKGFESIRTTLMVAFSVLIVGTLLLVSVITYNYTVMDARTRALDNTSTMLNEINASIDSYINNMKSMGALIVQNEDIHEWLNDGEDPELRDRAQSLLNIVQGTREDITNVAVIRISDSAVLLGSLEAEPNPYADVQSQDWYTRALAQTGDIIVYPSHVQNLVYGTYDWVISIARAIPNSDGETVGVMVIDLNYRSIIDICERGQLGKNGYIFLVDQEGRLIYHPQQQLLYLGLKTEPIQQVLALSAGDTYDGESHLRYTADFSSLTGWSAVGVVNDEELVDTYAIVRYHILIALAMVPLAIGAAVVIAMAVTKPIKRLEATMRKVEGGDLTVRSDIRLNNEIGRLSDEFNEMISRTQKLMERIRADEMQKRSSELKALQAQINPHFLYNTLDSIIWMAAGGRSDEVVEMASALAKLFRTSISRGDAYPPVATEIENIRSYLTIQKMRYRDRLTFEIDVPNDLLGYRMPGLILQPLVENAIYHGIKPMPDGGEIRVGGELLENDLLLWVEDTGAGMTPEQLATLFDETRPSKRGIGVANVNERIVLSFGPQYGLRYESQPGKGTRVTVHLPRLTEEETK